MSTQKISERDGGKNGRERNVHAIEKILETDSTSDELVLNCKVLLCILSYIAILSCVQVHTPRKQLCHVVYSRQQVLDIPLQGQYSWALMLYARATLLTSKFVWSIQQWFNIEPLIVIQSAFVKNTQLHVVEWRKAEKVKNQVNRKWATRKKRGRGRKRARRTPPSHGEGARKGVRSYVRPLVAHSLHASLVAAALAITGAVADEIKTSETTVRAGLKLTILESKRLHKEAGQWNVVSKNAAEIKEVEAMNVFGRSVMSVIGRMNACRRIWNWEKNSEEKKKKQENRLYLHFSGLIAIVGCSRLILSRKVGRLEPFDKQYTSFFYF